eukprot:6145118-Pyramimonas_sp.AAC.1
MIEKAGFQLTQGMKLIISQHPLNIALDMITGFILLTLVVRLNGQPIHENPIPPGPLALIPCPARRALGALLAGALMLGTVFPDQVRPLPHPSRPHLSLTS